MINQAIEKAIVNRSQKLNLENCKLYKIPSEILQVSGLKKLNVFGNNISEISEDILNSLPELTWLDIRKNNLHTIPRSISKLQNLRNLLVQDNKLKKLPLELGNLPKLARINCENNFLEFPSNEILQKGPQFIIKYLKMCYKQKVKLKNDSGLEFGDAAEIKSDQSNYDLEVTFPNVKAADNMLGDSNLHNSGNAIKTNEINLPMRHVEAAFDDLAIKSIHAQLKEDEGPTEKDISAVQYEIFKPQAYHKIAKNYFKSRRRSFRSNVWTTYRTQSERHAFLLGDQPQSKTLEQVRQDQQEQRIRLKQQKESMRQEGIIQRMKDENTRDDWKTKYRARQHANSIMYRSKSAGAIRNEACDRVKDAPFDISSDELSVMCLDELARLKMQARPAIVRGPLPPPRSKQVLFRMEQERHKKDLMLVAKIREHAEMLQLATNENTLENAIFDLDMALQLQKRLRKRQDTLTHLKMTTHPTAFL